ncbi:MAG: hypothetical protein AMXMBFR56_68110 [Polyangiaceae bacterium]
MALKARTRYFGGSNLPPRMRFKNTNQNPKPKPQAAEPSPAALRAFPAGLVTFTSGKERCGINEYSRGLDEQLRLAGATVSTHPLSDISLVASAPAGAELLVHAEPSLLAQGFFPALRASHRRGAKVVVCFHYCDQAFFRLLADSADILVTHRDYFPHPKLRVVPLACPVYEPPADLAGLRKKHGLPEDKVLLTTLGAWKKIPDLVQQLLPELERRGAVLQALCPTHFAGDATGEGAKLARLANGRQSIIWKSEFLPESEVLERVACSDLGLAYHGQNTGSVSAANKMFVAARVPLLLTSSTHDSDHLGAVHVPGFDLIKYARRATELAHDRAVLRTMRVQAQGDYDRMNQAVVAKRYLELFREIKK